MIIYFSFISQNVKNSEDEEMRETNLERLNAELVSLTALPEQPIEKSNDDSWSVSQFIPIVIHVMYVSDLLVSRLIYMLSYSGQSAILIYQTFRHNLPLSVLITQILLKFAEHSFETLASLYFERKCHLKSFQDTSI